MTERRAEIKRVTGETQIQLQLDLDGSGANEIVTGIGFFDHMLELFSRHALIDLRIKADGDLHVDAHHTVEDVGICLGQAIARAVGDKQGIARYGHCILPMDETLVTSAVDLSGRTAFVFHVAFPHSQIGQFDSELVEHFWQSVAQHAMCNFHAILHHGSNGHHISEAVFKSAARSFRQAVAMDPRQSGIPSTKGSL